MNYTVSYLPLTLRLELLLLLWVLELNLQYHNRRQGVSKVDNRPDSLVTTTVEATCFFSNDDARYYCCRLPGGELHCFCSIKQSCLFQNEIGWWKVGRRQRKKRRLWTVGQSDSPRPCTFLYKIIKTRCLRASSQQVHAFGEMWPENSTRWAHNALLHILIVGLICFMLFSKATWTPTSKIPTVGQETN